MTRRRLEEPLWEYVPDDPDDAEEYRRQPLPKGISPLPLHVPERPAVRPEDILKERSE